MPTIERSALLPYPAEALFNLVNDVEAYPKYLPWCIGTQIYEQTEKEVTASMTLSKGGITKVLKTRNVLHPPREMVMELIEGPFKSFSGRWCFEPLDENATKVTIRMSFEFEQFFIAKLIAPMFNQVGAKLLEAFCQYAKVQLGKAL